MEKPHRNMIHPRLLGNLELTQTVFMVSKSATVGEYSVYL